MIAVYRFFEKVVENIRLVLFVPLLGLYIFASLATMLFDLWGGALTVHELFARSSLPYGAAYSWAVAIFLSLATWATTVFAMLLTEDDVDFPNAQLRAYSIGRYVLRVADALGDASFLILYGVFPSNTLYANMVGGLLFALVCVVSLWGDTLVISFARNPGRLLKLIQKPNNHGGYGRHTSESSFSQVSTYPSSSYPKHDEENDDAARVTRHGQFHMFGGGK